MPKSKDAENESKHQDQSTSQATKNTEQPENKIPKGAPLDGGIQMFKMSSRSQMKHRAQKIVKRGSEHNDSEKAPISPNSQMTSQQASIENGQQIRSKKRLNLSNHKINTEVQNQMGDDFLRSQSYQVGSISQFQQNEQQLQIDDDSPHASLHLEESQQLDR